MLSSLSHFNECSQLQKMSKIVYLYVKPLFLYYFLLIATMTKTMFVNSQQILFIILFICEVITFHKIIIQSFLLLLFFLFFSQDQSKKAKPSTQNYSLLYITHGLDYIDRDQNKTQSQIILKFYSTRSRYNQKDRTKKNGKDRSCDGDTIPGHLPQAWQLLRGVPIPM